MKTSSVMVAWLALLLSGCGGGAADPGATSNCTLQNPSACGGSPSTAVTPPVTPPSTAPATPDEPATQAAAVSLLFSSTELKSAGTAGGEVGVTALVKNAANAALAGAKIAFSADSGILSGVEAVTDKNGQAKALLGTGGSNANRNITVSVKVGNQSGSGSVAVVGTSLGIAGPATIALGQSADLTLTLLDSAGRAIAGAPLTLSARNGNALTVKSGAAQTNAQGQLVLSLLGSRLGGEAVSVTAMGALASKALSIEDSELGITPAVGSGAGGVDVLKEVNIGVCQAVDVHYQKLGVGQTGSVNLSASRGKLYADSACTVALTGPLSLLNGDLPRSYVASANAGVATLTAAVSNGPTAQTRIEFVAPLTPTSTLGLQAEPAVIGSNAAGGKSETSTLTAIARDGSAANNLIKGATVVFSIISDPSGGYLTQPSSAITGSDGVAHAVYVAGSADSGKDGAVIQATIQGTGASASSRLTVAKKALSIQFGSGNVASEYSSAVLQKDFAVLVSDAAGNAVSGVSITASAWPSAYGKGHYTWIPDQPENQDIGAWIKTGALYVCPNEDVVRNGVYDPVYDRNGNGVLDPGIPVTVSASGKTDALGMTTVSLNFPRDHGSWVEIELRVRGSVAGTEAGATGRFWLPTLAKDFGARRISPPGVDSPYGLGPCDSPN